MTIDLFIETDILPEHRFRLLQPNGWITLTEIEAAKAGAVGLLRRYRSQLRGFGNKKGQDPEKAMRQDVHGAQGEKALANFLKVEFCEDMEVFKGPDVAGYQCRQTDFHKNMLLLRNDDSNDSVWVLVTGIFPRFWIRGWAFGHEVKEHGIEGDCGVDHRPTCWRLPTNKLHPMNEIPIFE